MAGFLVKRHRATALVAAITLAMPTTISARSSQRPAPPTPEQAPIAYMVDLSSGQTLYARDIDRRFVPASITKVMTTLVAFDMLADGELRPDQRVDVRLEPTDDGDRIEVGSTAGADRAPIETAK